MRKLIEKNIIYVIIFMMVMNIIQSVMINKKLTSLEQKNTKLDNKLAEMENSLNNIDFEIEKIKKDIEENQKLIDEKQQSIDDLENKVNTLETSTKEKETEVVQQTTAVKARSVDTNNEVDTVASIKETYGLEDKSAKEVTFHISFYTSLACENGGWANLTASGKTLADGMVANNHLPFGTKIYVEGYGLKTVEDRGSSKYFTDETKIDIFVPRQSGESDTEYRNRVKAMGRQDIKGYIFS